MSGSVEVFRSIENNKVKLFACGPSIYQRPHIGNYRTFLYEDMLIRYLEHSGYRVRHEIILTDIEDKSISEAEKKKRKVNDLTGDVADIFFRESKLLNVKLPDPVSRSSTSIDQAVRLIKKLLSSGHAYEYKGDIFFDPLKFGGFGKLFGLDMKRWPKEKRRFKKDTYNGRRWNLGDFILWHGYREGDSVYWDTEIGRGRPSWNIQDPAVVTQCLGYEIDINCGGIDNIYRHHDYNIAVIESVSGREYARYYLHGEHLIVNGKSMSKSRRNILYPADVLRQNYKPYHLRFFLLQAHYRKKLNFTRERFKKSSEYLDAIRSLIKELVNAKFTIQGNFPETDMLIKRIKEKFNSNMDNDLSFGAAVDEIYALLKKIKIKKDNSKVNQNNIKMLKTIITEIDEVACVLL